MEVGSDGSYYKIEELVLGLLKNRENIASLDVPASWQDNVTLGRTSGTDFTDCVSSGWSTQWLAIQRSERRQ